MGKVIVSATIENVVDVYNVRTGKLAADQLRRVEVTDAMVDTGATTPSLPKRLVAQLGLLPLRERVARTAGGLTKLQVYGAARVVVQGRECTCDVIELADECPPVIGQAPLELLDFVVDPQGQRLVGNPDHGGEQMVDVL